MVPGRDQGLTGPEPGETPFRPWGLSLGDLHTSEGLARLDDLFLAWTEDSAPDIRTLLDQHRARGEKGGRCGVTSEGVEAGVLLALAPWIERFVRLGLGWPACAADRDPAVVRAALLAHVRRVWVQRQVAPQALDEGPDLQTAEQCACEIAETEPGIDLLAFEEKLAHRVMLSLAGQAPDHGFEERARHYALWAMRSPEGIRKHQGGVLFRLQRPLGAAPDPGPEGGPERDGFNLTHPLPSLAYAHDQAQVCLICHPRGKDSCRTGWVQGGQGRIPEDKQGCPLGQRISEMTALVREGWMVAALAVITLDNPVVAGTGHRICYDCARACVFQKQDPVDIPALETRILLEVLTMDYGVEVYSLLTRWNPLRASGWRPQPASGYSVLVTGAGPAGMTFAHEMLNAGHRVSLAEGLPVSPLPDSLRHHPVRRFETLAVPLEERRVQGAGGVMDYGITARWDKTFLTLMRLLLERRTGFRIYGSVRMGGTLTLAEALDRGFDHVALSPGAGRPVWPGIPGAHWPGVRVASDFLMNLHGQEAFRQDALASAPLDLPVMVIGGGLTAVDAATEAHAFYIRHVERCLERWEELSEGDRKSHKESLDSPDRIRFETWLEHGRVLRQERVQAALEGRPPALQAWIRRWGGVHILYRRRLQESPAWRTHPHEVALALRQGVQWWEQAVAESIEGSAEGVTHIRVRRGQQDSAECHPCGTVLMAAGLAPNVALADEEPLLSVDKGFFRPVGPEGLDVFTAAERPDGRRITFLGDAHPGFHGSVVKAMASSRRAAPLVDAWMRQHPPVSDPDRIQAGLDQDSLCRVLGVVPHDAGWFDMTVLAPLRARAHRPGMICRVQWKAEAVPLCPVGSDPAAGTLEFRVVLSGASTRVLAGLQPGDPLSVMGPSGEALPVPSAPGIAGVIAEGASVIRILHWASVLRQQGSRVILWAKNLPEGMEQDIRNRGETLHVFSEYPEGPDTLGALSCLVLAGSAPFQKTMQDWWQEHHPGTVCHGLVQAPMQCMMKGVCGQCIQRLWTGEENDTSRESTLFFACARGMVSPGVLDTDWSAARLKRSRPLEVLNSLWWATRQGRGSKRDPVSWKTGSS